MKLKTVSEVLSASAIGASFGLWMHQCCLRCQTTETQIVIQAKPNGAESIHRSAGPEIIAVLYWTIIALLAFAVFKVLATTIY
jgi:hypothetical protein